MKMKKQSKTASYIICFILLFITLLPLFLMIINSFKTNVEITSNPLSLPKKILVNNYLKAWKNGKMGQSLINSALLTFATLVITILPSCMAAYALAKKKIKYKKAISTYFLVCNTLPKQLFLIPLFFILQSFNLISNRFALAVIYSAIFTPFSVFLLRTYFLQISPDIENSALIDGAGSGQIFFHIMMPIIQPGILTVSLIIGLWVWNEFLFAVTFLQNDLFYTVAVRFYGFTSRYVTEWGQMMAFSVIITVPVVIFFTVLQKRFISGMTSGGVKG